jgi:uncharacterized protein
VTRRAASRSCPICGKPAVAAHRPFCSPRCADVDLHRWLSGRYVIPASEEAPVRDDDSHSPDDERQ